MLARGLRETHTTLRLNRHGKDWFVLARGRHACPRDAWSKQDGRNTLNRHGTDGILLSRGLKKHTHKTFTEPTDMAQIGSCLLEDATFCLQDAWSKQDESSTLKRKQHGTDGIVFARGLRKNTQDFY